MNSRYYVYSLASKEISPLSTWRRITALQSIVNLMSANHTRSRVWGLPSSVPPREFGELHFVGRNCSLSFLEPLSLVFSPSKPPLSFLLPPHGPCYLPHPYHHPLLPTPQSRRRRLPLDVDSLHVPGRTTDDDRPRLLPSARGCRAALQAIPSPSTAIRRRRLPTGLGRRPRARRRDELGDAFR
jgi:hypothetical protein